MSHVTLNAYYGNLRLVIYYANNREIAAFGGISLVLREWEVSSLGVTDRLCDRQTDGRTNKDMYRKKVKMLKSFLFLLRSLLK